jgi:aminopeptidase N
MGMVMKNIYLKNMAVSAVALLLGSCSADGQAPSKGTQAAAPKALVQKPLHAITAQTGLKHSLNMMSYDVKKYDIKMQVFPAGKNISGTVVTDILILEAQNEIEFDLDPRFEITETLVNGKRAQMRRAEDKFFVASNAQKGDKVQISVRYNGAPYGAKKAPWDGGFTWSKDKNGKDWIGVSVQGEGCDLWWPCKDSFTDKPDSVTMSFTVPAGLSAAANGIFMGVNKTSELWTFNWQLDVPTSPYNISLNIGEYARVQSSYVSSNGTRVPIEFWALSYNEEKAQDLVKNQVIPQVKFLEKHLGPYPWGDEKLGFAETPYLGMEHQTINAYGNEYKINKYGFDWLLQHELAHEWFGNLVTHAKPEDMWLHEGFAMYMQPFYAGETAGGLALDTYLFGFYRTVSNCKPAVFKNAQSIAESFDKGDPYYSGVFAIQMLRNTMGDKAFFASVRRLLYGTKTPNKLSYPIAPRRRSTADYLKIISEEAGRDFTGIFDIYLHQKSLPELKFERVDDVMVIRFESTSDHAPTLDIPIYVDGVRKIARMVDGLVRFNVGVDSLVQVDPEFKIIRKMPIQRKCK